MLIYPGTRESSMKMSLAIGALAQTWPPSGDLRRESRRCLSYPFGISRKIR